jgi:hypothetical protein
MRASIAFESERLPLISDADVAKKWNLADAGIHAAKLCISRCKIDLSLEADIFVYLSLQPDSHTPEFGSVTQGSEAFFDGVTGVDKPPIVF